jgi:hypothetical protein
LNDFFYGGDKMGVNLDDIIGNKKQDILVDRTKKNMNMLMIGTGIVVFLIVLVAIKIIMDIRAERQRELAAAITRDAEKISSAVTQLYSDYKNGNAELIGVPQDEVGNDKLIVRYVKGQKLEFRLGYYFLTKEQVQGLVSQTAPLESPAPYVVKYTTGEVVNLDGVNGYYEVADLSAIANKQTPPSDYTLFINAPQDMVYISQYPNNIIRLNANIDMSAFNGDGWTPIAAFKGKFDGRGYKISNMQIRNSSLSHVGLFGRIENGAYVENLILENIDVAGGDYTGAIAGSCSGTVTNCMVSGRVSSAGRYVGGLFGSFEGTASYLSTTASVNGAQYVGGFAGSVAGGTISC